MISPTKLRVGVLFGGSSSEKEVSLEGGRNVYQKLDKEKYEVIPIFIDSDLKFWQINEELILQNKTEDLQRLLKSQAENINYEKLKEIIDFAFVIGHGKYMEDGCLQGLLELLDIPYNGSGVLGSALGSDKFTQRKILQSGGIEVPKYMPLKFIEWQKSQAEVVKSIEDKIGYPLVIKPSREGCSTAIGIIEQKDDQKLITAITEAFKWDEIILVEERILGKEITVSVLGNEKLEALPVTETPWGRNLGYLTLEDKFLPGGAEMITPAELSEELTKKAQATAVKVCQLLKLVGYPRIDMFVSGDRCIVLEPNTLPGITPSTMVFHQAAEAGLVPAQFLDKIIELGLKAHQSKKGPL
ncbi:D-alanine--D-alanine ligase [Patescibacteria group bacterium]|nr:D-alanine--D-alanine ligase [Patescibacteria group bacterium]